MELHLVFTRIPISNPKYPINQSSLVVNTYLGNSRHEPPLNLTLALKTNKPLPHFEHSDPMA